MLKLTRSQEAFLINGTRWYNNVYSQTAVLEAPAGFGKSFILYHFLSKFNKRVRPLILAETNEACRVLQQALNGKYEVKTVCSALNLAMDKSGQNITLKQYAEPDLSKYNLIVVDEASMLPGLRLDKLESYGIKLLLIGHRSQLPCVETENDKCLSPVFLRDYPTFTLHEPVRNTGDLFAFLQDLETCIYKVKHPQMDYRVKRNYLNEYLNTLEGKEAFLTGKAISLAFSEKGVYHRAVPALNKTIREYLFGLDSKEKFNISERLLFRKPINGYELKLKPNLNNLRDINLSRYKGVTFPVNTKAVVYGIGSKRVLGLDCYEVTVKVNSIGFENKFLTIYSPVDSEEGKELAERYYHKALYEKNPNVRKQRWMEYHDLTQVLGEPAYGYATTVHSAQGATYNTVFVDETDIKKHRNRIMMMKLLYVACSRASENLYRLI